MKKSLQVCLMALCWVVIGQNLSAQGGVGINATGALPDSSAILDVNSSSKGLLIPRMSSSQRAAISNPGTSLMVYDTTSNCLEMYGYGVWHKISCICTGAPSTPGTISGNANPCLGATTVIYSVAPVANATAYSWTVPVDATILSGQGSASILVNIGSTPGNISITASNDCGASSASVLPISINTIPFTPGQVSGPSSFPHNDTGVVYFIAAVSGASTYSWTVPGDAVIASGQGTDSLSVNFGSTSGNICVTAGNVCGTTNASCLFATDCYSAGSQLFAYTGGQQVFTVPGCVYSVTFAAYGAQGGLSGGLGGYAVGTMAVSPGQTFYVNVGGEGSQPTGGFNGGGTGGYTGGGGASDVRSGTDLSTRVIVAGGGGASSAWGSTGGDGGGANGSSASNSNNYSPCNCYAAGGAGGTQSGGGAAGYPVNYGGNTGQNGSLGAGGGTDGDNDGGGGGGYYGGGSGGTPGYSGWGSGGGGGSSYTGGLTNSNTTSAANTGNGSVTISW